MCSQCQRKPAVGAILQRLSAKQKAEVLEVRGSKVQNLFIGEYYLVGKYCEDDLKGMKKSLQEDISEWEITKVVSLRECPILN